MSIVVEHRSGRTAAPWQIIPTIPGHRFFDRPEHVPAYDTDRYVTVELERFDDVDVRRVFDRTTGTYGTLITPR